MYALKCRRQPLPLACRPVCICTRLCCECPYWLLHTMATRMRAGGGTVVVAAPRGADTSYCIE